MLTKVNDREAAKALARRLLDDLSQGPETDQVDRRLGRWLARRTAHAEIVGAEWVEIGRDVSSHPRRTGEEYPPETKVSEWLEGHSGSTEATYIPGHGLRAGTNDEDFDREIDRVQWDWARARLESYGLDPDGCDQALDDFSELLTESGFASWDWHGSFADMTLAEIVETYGADQAPS